MSKPDNIEGVTQDELVLLAHTRIFGTGVRIWHATNPDKQRRDWVAQCDWYRGRMNIVLSTWCIEKGAAYVRQVLTHEFAHAIEYLNDPGYLSTATTADNCTMLAQQIEVGLTDAWKNARLA